jgi:hypothetical protein
MSVTELIAVGALVFGAGGICASLRNVHLSVVDLGKRLRSLELHVAKLVPHVDQEDRC